MTFEDGLKAFLAASPYPLAVENRVYSHAATQAGATPYMVIYRIAVTPRMLHHGPPGMIERHMQFSIFGPLQSVILTIADELRRLINGYVGMMGDYDVKSCQWSGERPGYNETSKLHQIAADYTFQYFEPESSPV
jgi:hypothetical protein